MKVFANDWKFTAYRMESSKFAVAVNVAVNVTVNIPVDEAVNVPVNVAVDVAVNVAGGKLVL